jgi:hypothetical protein
MLLCRTVDMDISGEFQMAKKLVVKMKEVVRFRFRKWPMLEILWSIGYRYKRSKDGRKFSIQHTDTVAARANVPMDDGQNHTGSAQMYYLVEKKGKTIPVTGHGGPQGCETLRVPHYLDNRLTDGGKAVSLTRRSPLTTLEDS